MQPRIDQVLPSFNSIDAIGTETLTIKNLLQDAGYTSEIFTAEGYDLNHTLPLISYAPLLKQPHLLIHHFSIGSLLPYFIETAKSQIITRYHNITPPHFFQNDHYTRNRCIQGRYQLPKLVQNSPSYWAVSKYNSQELMPHPYQRRSTLPLLRNYQHFQNTPPCQKTSQNLQQTKNKRHTILFVGRLIPSKAQHDLLFLLKQYHRYINPNLRLILVGSGSAEYRQKLKNLSKELELKADFKSPWKNNNDVILLENISTQALTSCYQHADLFVCLSEHEGFCVPLVEAMYNKLPILAHKAAAIPETLGEAGYTIDKNQAAELLTALDQALNYPEIKAKYQNASKQRSQDFSWEKLKTKFYQKLDIELKAWATAQKST